MSNGEVKEFECPKCQTKHNRGWFMSPDIYRCLHCGYQGYGFHPDDEIDALIAEEIRQSQQWNIQHGIAAGEFAP